MSLFRSKPQAIFYLRRQDAVLIVKDSSVRLDIASQFVANLEVADAAKVSELVAAFLDSHKIHGQQILLVLDDSVVFQKTVEAAGQDVVKDYESKLPFGPEDRQLITTAQKGQVTLFGVNKSLYQAVAKGIQKSNKLKAVVPAALYGVQEDKKVDRQIVSAFFNDSKPTQQANFLT